MGKELFRSQVCANQLHDCVELVRGELSKLARRTLTAGSLTIAYYDICPIYSTSYIYDLYI